MQKKQRLIPKPLFANIDKKRHDKSTCRFTVFFIRQVAIKLNQF